MDDSDLQNRLHRIEQRQHLILVLLVIPYLLGIAKLIGFWTAGALYTVLGLVVFVLIARSRRRSRNTVGQ